MAFGATNNLGGLHTGHGVNVAFDKYDADITAGKTVNGAIKTVQTTAVADVAGITDASNLVNGLWAYNSETGLDDHLTVNGTAVVNAAKEATDPTYKDVTLHDAETDGKQHNLYADNDEQTNVSATGVDFFVNDTDNSQFIDGPTSFWCDVDGDGRRDEFTDFSSLYYTTDGNGVTYNSTTHGRFINLKTYRKRDLY